jgi:hypothetical protein
MREILDTKRRFMRVRTSLIFVSVGSPGVSKNALTVGASSYPDHEVLVYFSSIGYDYDNHMIKPNVVTPGTKLMSTGDDVERVRF